MDSYILSSAQRRLQLSSTYFAAVQRLHPQAIAYNHYHMSVKVPTKSIIIFAVIGICGFVIGRFTAKNSPQSDNLPSDTSSSYSFLAPRIFIESPNDPLINFTPLRLQLRTYMLEKNLKGSLYFEYLPTGTNVRVDDDSQEAAASLMKIPAVMELYKAAEFGRVDLDAPQELRSEWLDDRFGSLYQQGAGYTLSLREAARIALTDSDNTAINMVIALSRELLLPAENVLTFLDVDFVRPDEDRLTISARSYSSFLKCLYFSCYLSPDNSQQILTFLSSTNFNDRLRAGVPSEITMSHKIGTFNNSVMSDCGIIYEPKRPYLLCIMLEVADDQTGNQHFAAISKMAYEYIVQQ